MRILCFGSLGVLAACAGPGSVDAPVDTDSLDTDMVSVDASVDGLGTRPLTSAELRRTVLEVFGAPLADDLWLPSDPVSGRFDNQHLTPAESSSRLLAYDAALEAVAERAVRPLSARPRLEGQVVDGAFVGAAEHLSASWSGRVTVEAAGVYTLTATVMFSERSEGHFAVLGVDGQALDFLIFEPVADPPPVSHEITLTAGEHQIGVWGGSLATDGYPIYDSMGPVTLDGPNDPEPVNEHRAQIVTCDLDADTEPCVRSVITRLAPLAWRRAVRADEVDRLVGVGTTTLEAGGSPDDALIDALHALLLSPNFLMHLSEAPALSGATSDEALAARLSYFLWGAPPDAALRARASSGDLHTEEAVAAEVARMLRDPKGDALVTAFASQWLGLDRLDTLNPDPDTNVGWTKLIAASMKDQTLRYVRAHLLADVDMVRLVDDPNAWVDGELSAWTGEPQSVADSVVDRAVTGRLGLLGLSGVQAMLSFSDHASPTRRGAWILRNLLCTYIGEPPPGVTALDLGDGELTSLADRLEAHSKDPACASCHAKMDPAGRVLDNFSASGQPRALDEYGGVVSTVGALPDGRVLADLPALAAALAEDPSVRQCFVDTTFTWALGRTAETADAPAVAEITAAWEAHGRTFSALLTAIATSDAFRAGVDAP